MATSTSGARADSLIEALKRSKPVSLRVFLVDGTEREVAIPGKRKRWSQIKATLERMAWVRVEALDPKSRVLDIIDNDDAADDLEELDSYGGTAQVHQLTALMLRAQDVALKRNTEGNRQMLDMVFQLCKLLMDRLNALERGYAANLSLAQKFATEAGDDEGLMSGPMMEALAPHLLMKFMGAPPAAPGAKPPPPNNDPTK